MESSPIDPRKLLGFRVLLTGAEANRHDVDVEAPRLGAKIGEVKPPPPSVD